jgi:hypothetical protein
MRVASSRIVTNGSGLQAEHVEPSTASHRYLCVLLATMECERCGGFLVDERCMDVGEGGSGSWFWGIRCVQCGDVVDEIILRNRRHQHREAQVGQAA